MKVIDRPAPGAADVMLAGTVFCDIIFTGLPHPPAPGQEIWSDGMGTSPGGIANLAVACARLGLGTSLASCFSSDGYGQWCWEVLREEGVDLSCSRTCPQWHSPVTVSLAYGGDRAMITHGHDHPVGTDDLVARTEPPRAVIVSLGSGSEDWWAPFLGHGTLVFADVGWDDSERWDPEVLRAIESCHCFMPNAAEAQAYTRTNTPADAARALGRHVELAVVTDGARGVTAFEASSGELIHVPALDVTAIDPTGAGDVFGAAFVAATLRDWPLEHRLRFGALAAALSVQEFGGSLAAPGWGDIADWWESVADISSAAGPSTTGPSATGPSARRLQDDYSFLASALRGVEAKAPRRAEATIARHSDVGNRPMKGQHEND
ncbi:MAG: PfkB family carbohydrate kinase [Bifidobacteriaceae bacterium]|jgi:sugar/nucleoside kinase (ribokinase family)|nr:PfkB family carbohydrate kinase [Bifidobacteriaceae bacterium]